jgi:hypothetical protein
MIEFFIEDKIDEVMTNFLGDRNIGCFFSRKGIVVGIW